MSNRCTMPGLPGAQPLDAGETVDERVDQGAGLDPRSGMDDQPGRLVEDDDVIVGMDDIQRDILREKTAFPSRSSTWTTSPSFSL